MACPVQIDAGVVGDGGYNGDADDSLDGDRTDLRVRGLLEPRSSGGHPLLLEGST